MDGRHPRISQRAEAGPRVEDALRRDGGKAASTRGAGCVCEPSVDVNDDVDPTGGVEDSDLAAGANGHDDAVRQRLAGREIEVRRRRPSGSGGKNCEITCRRRVGRGHIQRHRGNTCRRYAVLAGHLEIAGLTRANRTPVGSRVEQPGRRQRIEESRVGGGRTRAVPTFDIDHDIGLPIAIEDADHPVGSERHGHQVRQRDPGGPI